MCKVAGVTKITDKNREDVWIFMMYLGQLMSKWNNDGLGYAAFDKKGNLFGEKWLENEHAFGDLSKFVPNLTAEKAQSLYSFFGDQVKRQEAQAIILHTRAATCEMGIKNTHPFVDNLENPSMAIIHNGVIMNHAKLEKKYSTCDSEVIVHLYNEQNIPNNFKAMNEVTQRLIGWYTVLALSKTSEGQMIMDIFTDGPRLNSFFIPELDTRVYSTSAQDILQAAKDFNFKVKDGKAFKANMAQRVDVLTGEVLDRQKCKEATWWPDQNVVWMDGNFDDEDFVKGFFGQK